MNNFVVKPRSKKESPIRDKEKRTMVFQKTNFCCAYCGSNLIKKEKCIDHKKPICMGGCDDLNNLVLACRACNARKNKNSIDDFRLHMEFREFIGTESNLKLSLSQIKWLITHTNFGKYRSKYRFAFEEVLK